MTYVFMPSPDVEEQTCAFSSAVPLSECSIWMAQLQGGVLVNCFPRHWLRLIQDPILDLFPLLAQYREGTLRMVLALKRIRK